MPVHLASTPMHTSSHSGRTRASHAAYLLGHLLGRATTTAATALRGGCPGSSEGGFRIYGSTDPSLPFSTFSWVGLKKALTTGSRRERVPDVV